VLPTKIKGSLSRVLALIISGRHLDTTHTASTLLQVPHMFRVVVVQGPCGVRGCAAPVGLFLPSFLKPDPVLKRQPARNGYASKDASPLLPPSHPLCRPTLGPPRLARRPLWRAFLDSMIAVLYYQDACGTALPKPPHREEDPCHLHNILGPSFTLAAQAVEFWHAPTPFGERPAYTPTPPCS